MTTSPTAKSNSILVEFKSEFIEKLQFQAEWRMEKSKEFPDDLRNIDSAAALRELAARMEALSVEATEWSELYPLYHMDDGLSCIEQEQEILRTYGFYGDPGTDAPTFLREIIEIYQSELGVSDGDFGSQTVN